MAVEEQDGPLRARLLETPYDPLAPTFELHPAAGSSECVSTSINRVGEEVQNRVLDRRLPDEAAHLGRMNNGREREPFLA